MYGHNMKFFVDLVDLWVDMRRIDDSKEFTKK